MTRARTRTILNSGASPKITQEDGKSKVDAETSQPAGYSKVIGALATGAIIVCGTSGYFSSSTQAEVNDARFEYLEAHHTLDGTANDNVTCICDTGYEAVGGPILPFSSTLCHCLLEASLSH